MVVQTRNSSKRSKASKAISSGGNTDDISVVSDDESPNKKSVISLRENEYSKRTWWMLDVEYEEEDDDSPSNRQGATPLVKRCMRVHGWSLETARKVLTAYRQFLTLKKEHEDWDATKLSPSLLVDQMWHQHILDVVNYYHDMLLLCGRVVGHNPDGALSGKAERDEATRTALKKRFPKYDKEIWCFEKKDRASRRVANGTRPGNTNANNDTRTRSGLRTGGNPYYKMVTLRMRYQDGHVKEYRIKGMTKMHELFDNYASQMGVSVGSLRFMIDGERVGDDEMALEIDKTSEIDVFAAQGGC